ncbi:MAG TPA: hypothetical protein PLI56_07425, partial [Exilispira sp.]|nr:hypothetical protein [Exilispira sp.]
NSCTYRISGWNNYRYNKKSRTIITIIDIIDMIRRLDNNYTLFTFLCGYYFSFTIFTQDKGPSFSLFTNG